MYSCPVLVPVPVPVFTHMAQYSPHHNNSLSIEITLRPRAILYNHACQDLTELVAKYAKDTKHVNGSPLAMHKDLVANAIRVLQSSHTNLRNNHSDFATDAGRSNLSKALQDQSDNVALILKSVWFSMHNEDTTTQGDLLKVTRAQANQLYLDNLVFHTKGAGEDVKAGFGFVGRHNPITTPEYTEDQKFLNVHKSHVTFSCENPLRTNEVAKFAKQQLSDARAEKAEDGNSAAKRAANMVALFATIAHLVKMIEQKLSEIGDDNLDATCTAKIKATKKNPAREEIKYKYLTQRGQIMRMAQALLALVIMMTHPTRGNETAGVAMDDVTEIIGGDVDARVPLILRCLFAPGTFTRPVSISINKYTGKDKQWFIRRDHDTLPDYATACSLPDVYEWCMRILLRLAPRKLFNHEQNPDMLLLFKVPTTFLPEEDPDNPLTTNNIDDWFKTYLPDCAFTSGVAGHKQSWWITSYSCRSSYAIAIKSMEFLDNRFADICALFRKWFGHTHDKSEQIEAYAKTKGRTVRKP